MVAAYVSLRGPALAVWGAGTGVGKTLVGAGLMRAVARAAAAAGATGAAPGPPQGLFLKPVQTGAPADSDGRLVAGVAGAPHSVASHAGVVLPASGPSGGRAGPVACRTLFAWEAAVSPHLAAAREGRPVGDAALVAAVRAELEGFLGGVDAASARSGGAGPRRLCLVETAGGPASPGPAGALQADLYRPLRLPALLVGGGELGGINAVVTAAEALLARGYDVPQVLVLEAAAGAAGSLENYAAVRSALARHAGVGVRSLPPAPGPPAAPAAAADAGPDAELEAWLGATDAAFDALLEELFEAHGRRAGALGGLAARALESVWYPFTQHATLREGDLAVVDSRHGEHLAVLDGAGGGLEPQFDACCSWWTQGVSPALQGEMARTVAHAAGRYGHVIHPETASEPVVACAEKLLATVGAGWASKVFFSDNGSTAVEVALKMAFRKAVLEVDGGFPRGAGGGDGGAAKEIVILAQEDSYHGDTLGCMMSSPPSVFNGRPQTPWYRARGHFLKPVPLNLRGGRWVVDLPQALLEAFTPAADPNGRAPDFDFDALLEGRVLELPFDDLAEAMSPARDWSHLAQVYRAHFKTVLAGLRADEGRAVGALLIEPLLQGAGGMVLIDPLWQRELVKCCKEAGIPVIFDEVFTGLWRLGAPSGAALLGVDPDVACFAKLLTGGVLPLSATVASEAIFRAFDGETKVEALLHGHSYSGHPLGCAVSAAALDMYRDPAVNPNYVAADDRLRELWDAEAVAALSEDPRVARAVALGTVCAVELEAGGAGGYSSGAAREVTDRLRAEAGVYARPLGNVVYLMCTPFTEPAACRALLEKLRAALDGRGGAAAAASLEASLEGLLGGAGAEAARRRRGGS